MRSDEEYTSIIKERLSEKRFIHSLNVAKSAKELAKLYGADEKKAYTAGLLHDVFKDTPKNEQLKYIALNDIPLTKTEISAPKLFHAICGAHYIKNSLDVEDDEIITAVRYHTTGRANMSLLEKVVFIADFIGEDRDYNGVEIMREKARKSLDEAIIEGLSFTIKDLITDGKTVHTDTVDAYNDAIINERKQKI